VRQRLPERRRASHLEYGPEVDVSGINGSAQPKLPHFIDEKQAKSRGESGVGAGSASERVPLLRLEGTHVSAGVLCVVPASFTVVTMISAFFAR
jgi:hypothetical protein